MGTEQWVWKTPLSQCWPWDFLLPERASVSLLCEPHLPPYMLWHMALCAHGWLCNHPGVHSIPWHSGCTTASVRWRGPGWGASCVFSELLVSQAVLCTWVQPHFGNWLKPEWSRKTFRKTAGANSVWFCMSHLPWQDLVNSGLCGKKSSCWWYLEMMPSWGTAMFIFSVTSFLPQWQSEVSCCKGDLHNSQDRHIYYLVIHRTNLLTFAAFSWPGNVTMTVTKEQGRKWNPMNSLPRKHQCIMSTDMPMDKESHTSHRWPQNQSV